MSVDRRYQLVAMGPAVDQFWDELKTEFDSQIKDIGLQPGQDAELLHSSSMKLIDILWESAPVAIWFGEKNATPTQRDLDLLEDFQIRKPNPVFPVCQSLAQFDEQVPPSLSPINGQNWEASSVVANVLKAFNLTRDERQVFISYRRSDSEAVAQQLYDALQHRNYRVFLDTASVDAGIVFQDVLSGRLSDVDLVVFLDTKNALNSDWVYKELLQAEEQGIGILQVLWPDRKRDRATQFCDLFSLNKTSFRSWTPQLNDDQPIPTDLLDDATLEEVVHEVERTRIRSIRTRRDQVLTEIVDASQNGSLKAFVNPTGKGAIPYSHIEFREGATQVGLAFPVVGFPDSILLQKRHDSLDAALLGAACVVYDELGMTAELKKHLQWLNQSLKIQSVPAPAISQWLEDLSP